MESEVRQLGYQNRNGKSSPGMRWFAASINQYVAQGGLKQVLLDQPSGFGSGTREKARKCFNMANHRTLRVTPEPGALTCSVYTQIAMGPILTTHKQGGKQDSGQYPGTTNQTLDSKKAHTSLLKDTKNGRSRSRPTALSFDKKLLRALKPSQEQPLKGSLNAPTAPPRIPTLKRP